LRFHRVRLVRPKEEEFLFGGYGIYKTMRPWLRLSLDNVIVLAFYFKGNLKSISINQHIELHLTLKIIHH
jgi:hypothetical protein